MPNKDNNDGDGDTGTPVIYAASQIPPPGSFSFKSEEWTQWVTRWERYRQGSGLHKHLNKTQVNLFIYLMGTRAEDILFSFRLNATKTSNYKIIRQRFNDHFGIRLNVVLEHASICGDRMSRNRFITEFIAYLYRLAETCRYGDLKKELIRHKLIVGL